MNTPDFIVTQQGTEIHYVPSATRLRKGIALALYGSTAMLAGGLLFVYYAEGLDSRFPQHGVFVTWGGCVIALVIWSVGVWSWLTRSTPLAIDTQSREVRYGRKILCEAGTVRAIRIRSPSSLEEDQSSWEIEFVLDYGSVKKIPSPWFSQIDATVATELAESVAASLKVNVQSPIGND